MNRLSLSTWGASAALHALVMLPLGYMAASATPEIYQDGAGQDAFKMEHGVAIDVISIGDAAERVELVEVVPMTANNTPPVIETKPVEPDLKSVITAKESPTETIEVVETPPEPVRTKEAAERDQAAQVAMLTEKSAGAAKDGGKATALSLYAGKINEALRNVKLAKRLPGSGSVTIGIWVDPAGRVKSRAVTKSSGIAAVDRFAVEMVDRASFPPPPPGLSGDEFYAVPITLSTKAS